MTNKNITEALAQLAEILPAAPATGTFTSSPFLLNKSRKAAATILVGTPGTGGTVNAQILWSATSGGSYAPVTGSQIVPLTTAGAAQIEIRGDRMLSQGQAPYYQLQVVVTVAATPIAGVVQGADGRYEPHSDNNDATILNPAVVV